MRQSDADRFGRTSALASQETSPARSSSAADRLSVPLIGGNAINRTSEPRAILDFGILNELMSVTRRSTDSTWTSRHFSDVLIQEVKQAKQRTVLLIRIEARRWGLAARLDAPDKGQTQFQRIRRIRKPE